MIRRFGSSTLAQEYEKAEVWIQREISETWKQLKKGKTNAENEILVYFSVLVC